MNKLIKVICGLGLLLGLFSYTPVSPKKVIKYYFLLDRNSQTLIYRGDTCRFTPVKQGCFYFFFTESHAVGFDIGGQNYELEERLLKVDPKPNPVKKPLRFLDTIKYYNEDWIRKYYSSEIDLIFRNHPDTELECFVIDEASVNNDSLYVCQADIVCVDYD